MNLNKTIKEKVSVALVKKAFASKLQHLQNRTDTLSVAAWCEYEKFLADNLSIPSERYGELIALGAFKPRTILVAKIELELGATQRSMRDLLNVKGIERKYAYYSVHRLEFKRNFPLPDVNDDAHGIGQVKTCPNSIKARAILTDYEKMLDDAIKFKRDVDSILAPIRTRKVLIGRLPEAAQYLPEPSKPSGNLVPVELIENVRKKLKG